MSYYYDSTVSYTHLDVYKRQFIGDVGRADLREKVGNIKAKQAELACLLYTSRCV